MSIVKGELINLGLDISPNNGWVFFQSLSLNLVIEMANVTNNGVVLHLLHMLKGDDSLVSSGSDINVHALKLVFNSNNFETLHAGLECADGVDFCDINSSSASPHGLGAALSNITKATNKNFFA